MPLDARCPLGANWAHDSTCRFCVWAPNAQNVQVRIVAPEERLVDLTRDDAGYYVGQATGIDPGTTYFYRIDGEKERPDPASRFQPEGVHGPSAVVDPAFQWGDSSWRGIALRDYVLYELHVGTFSPDGTFDAVIPHLNRLKELGITAIELMPVAQFPGNRNWGYDGVYPFAVQNSYGGSEGLKKLVDACHQRGMALVLDVVTNHLGPEGNYLADFGPYFTGRYRTPWGPAINFDGQYSDEVRHFFVENAVYWIREFRMDALRIDAIHGIFDASAVHFLEELAFAVHAQRDVLNREIYVIAENDLNDSRVIKPRSVGGYGLDGVWNDDFHHALHTLLTNEQTGYYIDFGQVSQLTKSFSAGFVFSGQYSVYRRRRHGNSSAGIPPNRFVVFSQNHDQVGNRMLGERLGQNVTFEKMKLAAYVVLLSPYIPLLFMGEEYGETAPFPYFVSHSDPDLVEAVRRGRREEFAAFQWLGEPLDPQDEATFESAKLHHDLREKGWHRVLEQFYKELLRLRKRILHTTNYVTERGELFAWEKEKALAMKVAGIEESFLIVFHFGDSERELEVPMLLDGWRKGLDSAETMWSGPGSPAQPVIVSQDATRVTLAPYSCTVLSRPQEIGP